MKIYLKSAQLKFFFFKVFWKHWANWNPPPPTQWGADPGSTPPTSAAGFKVYKSLSIRVSVFVCFHSGMRCSDKC